MAVRVTFIYEPDDGADPDDPTGVTEFEFDRMHESLLSDYGADDIEFERVGVTPVRSDLGSRPKKPKPRDTRTPHERIADRSGGKRTGVAGLTAPKQPPPDTLGDADGKRHPL